jgi:hypothetical protein
MSSAGNQALRWPEASELHDHLERVRAELGIQITAGLGRTAEQLQSEMAAELETRLGGLARRLRERPWSLDWTTDSTASAATYTVLRSGHVPGGKVWDVRRGAISAGGNSGDPFTSLVGVTAILVKSTLMAKNTSALEPQFQLINSDGPVPNDYNFSRGTLGLKAGEELSVIVKGAGNGILLAASWGVEVYPESVFPEA